MYPDSSDVRVAEYRLAAYRLHRWPIYSLVFNISGPAREPVRIESLPMGGQACSWITVCVPEAVKRWPAQLSSPLAIVLRALHGTAR